MAQPKILVVDDDKEIVGAIKNSESRLYAAGFQSFLLIMFFIHTGILIGWNSRSVVIW